MNKWYRWDGNALIINVRVQPRGSRDEILGPHGDNLKVKVTCPPVEGQANARLIKLLAKAFQVPASRITLLSGAAAREKRLRIEAPRALPYLAAR